MNSFVVLDPPAHFDPKVDVAATLCESGGKFLLLQTSQEKEHRGLWGLPAGKLNSGERPIEGALREMEEETGIALSAERLTFQLTAYVREAIDFRFHLFRCTLSCRPHVRLNPPEHSAWRWVAMEELVQMPLIPCALELFALL